MPGSSRSVGEHRSRNRRPIFPTGHKIPRSRASCGYCIPLSILHSEVDPHVKKCEERVHVENAGRYGSGGVTSAQRNYRRGKGQCWARHTESSQCSPESPTWAHAPSGILGPGQAGRTRVLHLHPEGLPPGHHGTTSQMQHQVSPRFSHQVSQSSPSSLISMSSLQCSPTAGSDLPRSKAQLLHQASCDVLDFGTKYGVPR